MSAIGPVGPRIPEPRFEGDVEPPVATPAAPDTTEAERAQAAALAAMRALPAMQALRGQSSLDRSVTPTEDGAEARLGARIQGRAGPLSGSAGASVQATVSDRVENGNRVATAEARAQADVNIHFERGRFSSGFSATEGAAARARAEVVGGQPGSALPDPMNPRGMPIGSAITFEAERFSNRGYEAAFRGLATETQISDVNRVSARIERTGEHTVRVTAGPSQHFTADNTFGANPAEGVRVRAGRTDHLEGSQQRTATFDLSTPEGTAGYHRFLSSGRLPTENGTGVSEVRTERSTTYESGGRLELHAGEFGRSVGIDDARGSRTQTQQPDGTSQVETNLRWGGNVPLRMEQQFGADGREVPEARRYHYDLTLDAHSAQALNAARGGQGEPLVAGQRVTVSLDAAQMEALRQTAAGAAAPGRHGRPGENPFRTVLEDTAGRPHDAMGFALSLARSNDRYGLTTTLAQLAPEGGAPISVTVAR